MNDIVVIPAEDPRWDEVIRSFACHDIYYLRAYVRAFQLHGDGEPLLICYENGRIRAVNVVMKRDIAHFAPFAGVLEPGTYYDTVTPYGYGGFLFEGELTAAEAEEFKKQYEKFCREQGIIADFTRFHPLLKNAGPMRQVAEVTDLGHTIYMDLASEETIWNNIASKNRNMIRKAQKAGIEIHHGQGKELLRGFTAIYNATMDRDKADPYYYFETAFYDSICEDLRDHYELFYAVLDGEVVAMSIMLYCNGQMHYHLSGSKAEYRHLAPSNLLLYEAARWGCTQGFRTFHLGGGVGSDETGGLYKFKQAFNRNSDITFSIGRMIFDRQVYDRLVDLRRQRDAAFDPATRFFPRYRG